MPADMRLVRQARLAHRQAAGPVAAVRLRRGSTAGARRYMSAIARLKPGVDARRGAGAAEHDRRRARRSSARSSNTGWGALVVPMHRELVGRHPSGAARALGRGRLRAAHRLRQRRQPAARARRHASARDRDSQRARRGAPPRRPAAAHRKPGVCASLGGALGLLVAQWSLDVLLAISPVDLADLGDVHLSYPVLAFTATVSLATAIVCGFAPAFEGSRADVQEALKDGSRQVGAGVRHRRHPPGVRRRRSRARGRPARRRRADAAQLRDAAAASIRASTRSNVLTARVTIPTARYASRREAGRVLQRAGRATRRDPRRRERRRHQLPAARRPRRRAPASRSSASRRPPPGQEPVDRRRASPTTATSAALKVPLVSGRLFTRTRDAREVERGRRQRGARDALLPRTTIRSARAWSSR